jgi:hypothetical protein
LIDVRLGNIDVSKKELPYYYKSRTVTIRTDNGDIHSPSRMTARTEYVARGNVPLKHPPPLDLAIDFKPINTVQLNEFLKNNGVVTDFRRHAKKFAQLTERTKLCLSFYQPTGTALTTFKKLNSVNKKQFIEMQGDFLQRHFGTDILTYPYIDYPFSEYKKYVDTYFSCDPYSTIFAVDMNAEPRYFRKVLDYLVQKGVKLIALLYADVDKAPIQHYTIASRYADKENLGFVACQVPRKYLKTRISGLHPLQFTGIDLVAPTQKSTGGPMNRSLNNLEFFIRKELLFENIRSALEYYSTVIINDMELHHTETNDAIRIRKMIRGYKLGEKDDRAFSALFSLSRIHECVTSMAEFDTSRQLIKSGESDTYFAIRPALQKLELFTQARLG